jgi:glutathione S-transferase
MSTYKLYYFDGRGRGEISRLILATAGQKFEDVRYQQNEWPSHKSEMPLGQMPVLEIDGIKLPQSMTIARFLARQFHLAGKDNLEQAKVEAVADTATDLLNKFGPIIWYQEEPQKKASIEEFFANELPKHLRNLETLAKAYSEGSSFFVGSNLTFADLCVYDVLENILEVDANILDQYPWLKINGQKVAEHPNIATYLKSRPRTAF